MVHGEAEFKGVHGILWRTRMCELLKSWLRANAASSSLAEEEARANLNLFR